MSAGRQVVDIKDPLRFKNMQQLRESYNPQLSQIEQYNLELMRLEQTQRIDTIINQNKTRSFPMKITLKASPKSLSRKYNTL